MFYRSVVLFLCTIYFSSASIVNFLPTSTFNVPSSFEGGKLPCSKEIVVFPDTLMTSVKIDSEIYVNGFILPQDGVIILADTAIVFGADAADVNCTQERNVYYLDRAVVKWSEPDIWSSQRFNDATPDAERVPCFGDIVSFPSNAEFTMTFPDQIQSISEIRFGSDTCTNIFTCRRLLVRSNSEHNFILNKFSLLGLKFEQKKCVSKSGCPCQEHPLKINCESKSCSVPTCVDPIKPEGHCCKICGGVIRFDIDQSFDIMMFRELVEQTTEGYGTDNLIYHIGRLPNDKVQLVVVERTGYSGKSAEVVHTIDHQMKRHWVQGAKLVDISGSPLDMAGLGGKIFVSMFFLVVLVMSGIYVYYYKLPEITDVRLPTLRRTAPGVFSRFQTRTDSVVCLTRRDSEATIGRNTETAFRNPLYDSTTQREEVDDTDTNE